MAAEREDFIGHSGQVPVLSNFNYQTWKEKMEPLLQVMGCRKYICEPEPTLPEGSTIADRDRFDSMKEKTIGLLKMYMSGSQATILEGIDSPLEAWKKIRDTFCPKSRARIAELRREFILLKPKVDEHMGVFIARVRKVVKDLI